MKMLKGKRKGKLWLGGAGVVAFLTVFFIVLISMRNSNEIHAEGYTFIIDGQRVPNNSQYEMRTMTKDIILDQLAVEDITHGSNWELYDNYGSDGKSEVLKIDKQSGTSVTISLTGIVPANDSPITLAYSFDLYDSEGNKITDENGQQMRRTIYLFILLPFAADETLNGAPNGATFRKVMPKDSNNSLVLNYGNGDFDDNKKPEPGTTLPLGTGMNNGKYDPDPKCLNLLFKDATAFKWESEDSSIVSVKEENGKCTAIQAMGVGKTILKAYPTNGGEPATMNVYVTPSIYKVDKETQDAVLLAGYDGQAVKDRIETVEDGDIIRVTYQYGPKQSFNDKVKWVITRQINNDTVFVKDYASIGDDPRAYPDDIFLGKANKDGEMIVHAKAGLYNISFYTGDTYTDYKTSQSQAEEGYPNAEMIPAQFTIQVNSSFKDKEISVGVGGSYDLSSALNISKEILKENFDIQIVSGGTFVTLQEDGTVVKAGNNLGTATISVEALEGLPDMPGVKVGDKILLTVKVINTFSLNVNRATMSVGSTLDLTGVIGALKDDDTLDASQFTWEWDDKYVDVYKPGTKNEPPAGAEATVYAKARTAETTIKLSWKDSDGVTWVSYSTITITDADTNFTIEPPTKSLAVGETFDLNLKTTLSGDQPNIIWFTADETICTVEALKGNLAARITAGNKTGQTIITAFNKENNTYATCIVTVTSAITSIKIDKGEEYKLNSTTAFAFLKAIYTPTDATETELKWTVKAVQGTDVLTLEPDEEDATLTINKAGIVDVTVEPVNNPNGVIASCRVIIEDLPITGIKTDVTKLDMIKGDKYEVKVDLTPATPTDSTLTWSSDDTKVATVDNKGVITATGVGSTVIKVNGGVAPTQTIMVNVRDKLQSIAFEHPSETIKVKETRKLNVIFTPNVDVKKDVTFRSTDEKIVKVNATTGEITGVAEGMAMIIASSEEVGAAGTITCMIIVTPEEFTVQDFKIDPEEITIKEKESFEIISSFTPDNATDKRVVYASFDAGIAEVDENGRVVGNAVGDTYIQCTSLGSGISRFCHVTVETSQIVVEDFNITPAEKSIHVDETFDIVPSFTPEDADNKEVEYISFDPSIASVSEAGTVTGLTVGDTYIQCTSMGSGISKFCHVTVNTAVTLSISPTTREIAIGKSFKITKTVSPDASDTTATWKSSDRKIAAVNKNGKVTGKRIGSCTVICTLDKYGVSASCRVKVAKLKTTLTIDKKSIRLNVGQSYKLKKKVWSNNTNIPSVNFTSQNKRIATVGKSSGRVTGKKVGTTIVTAKSADAVKATAKCRVAVIHRSTGVRLNKTYSLCYVGSTIHLKATVLPKTSTIKSVKWSSSNPEIADVLSNGKVTGYAEGEVYITATTTDGSNKSAKCLVKVVEPIPVTDILVAQSKITLRRGDTDNLAVTLLPDNTSDNIKMASDNKKVATVTNSGKVTAVGTGTATITITATGGVTSTVTVEVVDLNKTSMTMRQYDTETLQVLGTDDTITWYSSNNRVATVVDGLVTAKSIGQTTVYAYVNGCRISCAVRVVSVNAQR